MTRYANRKFTIALTLMLLTASAGRAFAQSDCTTDPSSCVVTGTDPEPQVVTHTNPAPGIVVGNLILIIMADVA